MTRRRKRRIIVIIVLLILLLLVGAAYINYRSTRSIGFDLQLNTTETLLPPQYLFSFSGTEAERMTRPLGVLVSGDEVFVTDSEQARIFRCSLDGELLETMGQGRMVTPLYLAENPLDGNLYISDRRLRTILIMSKAGEYVGEFDPELPEDELAPFETGDVQWAPIALGFAPDGSLYVTEILNGHRLLMFNPEGEFQWSVGSAGVVADAGVGPEVFQFPNGVKVLGDSVYVTDSNNRRIQVFSLDGEFERFIETEGLPRGFDFLNMDTEDAPERFAVVDTLAHDATIWNAAGDKVLNFGERGVLEGQFSYPNDLSVSNINYMYITDTSNGRVQVWGWPADAAPIPTPQTPMEWLWCLSPLLLLLLPLLLRKTRFYATADFLDTMLETELVNTMPKSRRAWMVTPETYEVYADRHEGDLRLGDILEPAEHSDSDTKALMERLELTYADAKILSSAQRTRVFCTENLELRRVAKLLEIDVVDQEEFLDRFTKHGRDGVNEQ
ncbi:MAG: hypothetical protein PF636_00435 [Actinomycetota bacterium]|jgi:sugar lactone lactonase YvrE/predicted nucleic acid-binding protein|nr:hypothetical protein [Actinomycetota bacterium]